MNLQMLHIFNLIKGRSINDILIFISLIIYWFIIWSSVGVEHKSIFLFGSKLIEKINFFRINTSLFLSLTSSLFLIYIVFLKQKKIKTFEVLFLFYIYFTFQLIGLILNTELNLTLGNSFLLVLAVGTVNIFLILKLFNIENFSKILLYLSLFFCLFFVTFILISKANKFSEYLSLSTFYSLSLPSDRFLDNAYPRTTGLSRLFAVINLFFITTYLSINLKNHKFLGLSILIIIFFIGAFIWGFQSRGTIISYFTGATLLIFLFKGSIKDKLANFTLIILFPIIIFLFSSSIARSLYLENIGLDPEEKFDKIEILESDYFEKLDDNEKKVLLKKLDQIQKNTYANRFLKDQMITSGRLEIWSYILHNYEKKKIFGYGIQGDRYLLNEKYENYGNNSSNAFIYFWITGGYFSLVLLIIILSRIYYILIKICFFKQNILIKESFIFKLSFGLILFFSVRSLVENSYGLFSVDFLITTTCFFIIENLNNKSINEKLL